MGNPYFKTTYNRTNNESLLYMNATDELCEMLGVDFKYIKKTLVKADHLFGEDTLKKFGRHRQITFYIENYENFEGVGDMFAKFGYEVDNRLTLIIGQDRFKKYTDQDQPEVDDLIYHDNSGKIFRITHVDPQENFYQMNGGEDRFKITCELHTPSHEDYDTNIDNVDVINDETDSNNSLEEVQVADELEDILDLSESDVFGNL